MKEHKNDRRDWPPGPWDTEPDRWEGEIGGFAALALRNRAGTWCGYLGLPPGHRWLPDQLPDEVDNAAHGGLTYGPSPCEGNICHTPRPGQPDDVRWIGFDCNHAGDLAPGMLAASNRAGIRAPSGDVYRDLQYVKGVIASLAALAQRPD